METYKNKYDFIKKQMNILAVPYEFGGWESKVTYPYFAGESTETPTTTEDGYEETTLLLNGFHRGKYIVLEEIKEKIEAYFKTEGGMVVKTDSGSVVAIFYANTFGDLPTGDAELEKIEINLIIKEWSVK